jgi:uncharacterized protein (TIGR00730 family)
MMKRICVFAGSNSGRDSAFTDKAIDLGRALVEKEMELVYGGSKAGLMGSVANTVLRLKGKAIGVMPSGLFFSEAVHKGLTELYEVKDMHERKAKMNELSDAFIALPGGFGTFEEVFEVISWGQLGLHQKPVGLLNINGFYQSLIDMVDTAIEGGFIPESHSDLLIVEEHPDMLLERLINYQPLTDLTKKME